MLTANHRLQNPALFSGPAKKSRQFFSTSCLLLLCLTTTPSIGESLALVGDSVAVAVPGATAAGPSSYVPAGYGLTWSDECDTLSLDLNASGSNHLGTYFFGWNTRRLYGNSDDGVKMDDTWRGISPPTGAKTIQEILSEAGWPSPSLHRASNGTLKMRSYPIPQAYQAQFDWYGAAPPSAASMITTEYSHSQQYGYWEVRAKLNAISSSHHFAMWLLPKDGSWPPEIDMLETLYDDNNPGAGLLSSANSHGGPGGNITFFKPTGGMLNTWHTYGFLWTPTEMEWYVDGQQVRAHANYVDTPMYFLGTWEIGGSWPGEPNGATVWPPEIEIDYVRVYEQGAPIAPAVTISASSNSVSSGQSSTLTWSSTNATSCTASGGWTGTKPMNGSEKVTPVQTTTYTLTCAGQGGPVNRSVTVVVTPASAPTPPPTPAPTLSFSANPTTVASGGSTTLTWSSTNAHSCVPSGDWIGTAGTSGSQVIANILSNKTYTLTCTGSGGSVAKTATVAVSAPTPTPPPSTVPTAHWKLDEASGTTAADASGNGNNGTLINGPTWTTGKIGKALDFDGTDDRVSVPSSSLLNTASGTWSGWIKADALPPTGYYDAVFTRQDTNTLNGATLFLWGDDKKVYFGSSNHWTKNPNAGSTTALAVGQWYHIAVTFSQASNSVNRLYLNGREEGTSTNIHEWIFANESFDMGDSSVAPFWGEFDGTIDDVRVYNRNLSASEILALYNEGGTTPPPAPAPTPPPASSLPDVIATSVSYANGTFTSVVKNQGTASTPADQVVGVAYLVDGTKQTWGAVNGPLAPGASVTIGTDGGAYTIPSGTHTMTAYVDDVNRFAESYEANNQLTQSITISPPADTTPPTFTNISANNITRTTAKITWNTNETADGLVRYGTSSGNLNLSKTHTGTSTSHVVDLTGLTRNTRYYYTVTSKDAAGNAQTSTVRNFVTKR